MASHLQINLARIPLPFFCNTMYMCFPLTLLILECLVPLPCAITLHIQNTGTSSTFLFYTLNRQPLAISSSIRLCSNAALQRLHITVNAIRFVPLVC